MNGIEGVMSSSRWLFEERGGWPHLRANNTSPKQEVLVFVAATEEQPGLTKFLLRLFLPFLLPGRKEKEGGGDLSSQHKQTTRQDKEPFLTAEVK